ncbi:MAG TPA: hypothetical protein VMT00_00725 [Thermoanaerobaculia bacterium]|nr:hypothetical protein [Thermoanaerobaculia bacterium]
MASTTAERISRKEAVDRLREHLGQLADEEHSVCQVAAERGLFCRGFARYSDEELEKRYYWLVRRDRNMDREELEGLANQWQLARQLFSDLSTACDVQQIERDTCRGWDDFTDRHLEEYCHELLGQSVEIDRGL